MIASDKLEKGKNEIRQSVNSITFGVILGFVLTLSEIYKSFSQEGDSTFPAIGLVFSFIAGTLLLFVPVMLKRESKQALTLVLLALGLGAVRWVFIEETFNFNFPSIILLLIFGWFVVQFLRWIRVGALR